MKGNIIMIPDQDSFPVPNPEEIANISAQYLDLVKNHANEISWLLEQHANLRSEYVTFFKKDLKEIEVALQGITSDSPEKSSRPLLEKIVGDFRRDLERSYDLLNFTFFWNLVKAIENNGENYEQKSDSP